jgi:nucleoside-diphosphate-sugar epimerase
MKVIVTGATGFTGSHTLPLLLRRGLDVRCLVRNSRNINILSEHNVELAYGDLNIPESLERAFEGVDALVNIASLGFGHAANIVQAAVRKDVQRAVFMSTTAIFTRLTAASKSVRLAAEEIIRNSNLDYTILRPTMIYGSSKDRNICHLIHYLKRWPVIPVFGNGKYLQQPVYVKDVSSAIVGTLLNCSTVHKSYNIAGLAPLTFNQMIDTICTAMGRKVYKIHLPAFPIAAGLKLLEGLGIRFPIRAEQILRLNENKDFDYSNATRDFGYTPISFSKGIRLELSEKQNDE